MGFRSTFISQDYYFAFPQWFVDKHGSYINFSVRDGVSFAPISTRCEVKLYHNLTRDIWKEIQQALVEWNSTAEFPLKTFVAAILHECGGITRVVITPKTIKIMDAVEFDDPVDGDTDHHYCANCHNTTSGL